MTSIAVLGAGGMLGRDVVAAATDAGVRCRAFERAALDIANPAHLERLPACEWVVNCAAYTNVDGAESDAANALLVNGAAAGELARHCARRSLGLLHVSTDYVFDGTKREPYTETDPTSPLNVYGTSKLRGEEEIVAAGGRHLIARTQALFGRNGRNFVAIIAGRLRQSDDALRVVDDQWTCPTYTRHLATALLRLLACGREGLVNVSASGSCSWYAFARAIAGLIKPGQTIHAVTSAEFVRPARRPANAVLDKTRFEEWTGTRMPAWGDGLREYLVETGMLTS